MGAGPRLGADDELARDSVRPPYFERDSPGNTMGRFCAGTPPGAPRSGRATGSAEMASSTTSGDSSGRCSARPSGRASTSAEAPAAAPVPATRSRLIAALAPILVSLVAARRSFRRRKVGTRFRGRRGGLALIAVLARPAAIAGGLAPLKFRRVFLLLFEEIRDVEERVALQSHVDKCGLHSGKDPGDSALVNRAGECVFVFALVVDFRELIVFKNRKPRFMRRAGYANLFCHSASISPGRNEPDCRGGSGG